MWDLVREHAIRHRAALLLALGLSAIPGIAVALQTLAPKYLIDSVLAPAGLTPEARLFRLGALLFVYLVGALILRMAAWYGAYKVWTNVREQITGELRTRFFEHINQLCLRFHGRHSSGELFTYVMGSPLGEISSFYHNIVMNVPNAVTAFLFSVALIGMWDWGLTLVLIVLVVATVLAMRNGRARLQELHENFQQVEMKIIGRLTDIFRGNRDVKLYGIEERMNPPSRKTPMSCARKPAIATCGCTK
jgi:ABC-type multidrug transport system fused ATPase/permease subunit